MSGFAPSSLLAKIGDYPYVSGEYYSPEDVQFTAVGTAGGAGSIRLTPGRVRDSVSIQALIVRITTLAAGGNFQVALYASDPVTGKPTGAPLFTSASQSTAATGDVAIAAALALTKGRYWLGIQVDATGAATVFTGINSGSVGFTSKVGLPASANILQPGSTNIIGYIKAGVFGTWPTLTGNAATDGLTAATGSGVSAWAFRVA